LRPYILANRYVSSSVRLSVVCNIRAPYSAGWNFWQCFRAIWSLAIRWRPRKILRISC